MRRVLLLACVLLGACAAADPYRAAPVAAQLAARDAAGDCARRFAMLDTAIDALGVRDAAAVRVPGFPFVRVDRVHAALATELDDARDAARVRAWLDGVVALDAQARRIEVANAALPAAAGGDLDALAHCRALLVGALDGARDGAKLTALRAAATVPDDYSDALRALGLYPLTRLAFAAGIRRWHEDTLAVFNQPEDALARRGVRRIYGPRAAAAAVKPLARDALGVPRADAATLAALLQRHAPVWDIDTASDDDRIGALVWQGAPAALAVDVAQPTVDAQVAYTRLAGRWQLQLVYTAWFAARPPQSRFDALAGPFDGVVWRVTLDDALEPLVYDAIHPCGCYHLFFPTSRLAARPVEPSLDEGLFAPQTAPALRPGQRLRLRIESRTHYLQRVAVAGEAAPDLVYGLRDADTLRSLPLPGGGTRSAFDRDGLLPGSERLERAFFWPMGIASAGQMRQWGRHATAFVGRRHFDDPALFDRYFLPGTAAAAANVITP